jgi:HlyD family secretion protein
VTVTATGTLQPITEVCGYTSFWGSSEIYVDYNSVVKQGRLLAELDKVTLNSAVVLQAAYNGNKRTELHANGI